MVIGVAIFARSSTKLKQNWKGYSTGGLLLLMGRTVIIKSLFRLKVRRMAISKIIVGS